MNEQYTIGVDFGTLSSRALVVRVRDGAELGNASFDYPHAVIDQTLPSSGKPLCFLEARKNQPHTYVKLWKQHAAQPQADRINALVHARGERWLPRYGGKSSSECFLAKALQIFEEVPEIYAVTVMGQSIKGAYKPNLEHQRIYDALYAEYKLLHDHFGRGANDVMKRLKAIRNQAKSQANSQGKGEHP